MKIKFYKLAPNDSIEQLLEEEGDIDYFLLINEDMVNSAFANHYPIIYSINGDVMTPYFTDFPSKEVMREVLVDIKKSAEILEEQEIEVDDDTTN